MEPSRSVSLGFFVIGVFNNFTYVLALTAAKDLLPPHSFVSFVLLIADVPALLMQALSPYYLHIPYRPRVLTVTALNVFALLLMSSSNHQYMHFVGIGCASAAFGMGESTMFSLLSHFDKSAISAYSSGTGTAGVSGAGFYYALTILLGLTSHSALLMASFVIPAYYLAHECKFAQIMRRGAPFLRPLLASPSCAPFLRPLLAPPSSP